MFVSSIVLRPACPMASDSASHTAAMLRQHSLVLYTAESSHVCKGYRGESEHNGVHVTLIKPCFMHITVKLCCHICASAIGARVSAWCGAYLRWRAPWPQRQFLLMRLTACVHPGDKLGSTRPPGESRQKCWSKLMALTVKKMVSGNRYDICCVTSELLQL